MVRSVISRALSPRPGLRFVLCAVFALLAVGVAARCGSPPKIHPPKIEDPRIPKVPEIPAIVPAVTDVGRSVEEATPDELRKVARSTLCDSLVEMVREHRFPSQDDVVTSLQASFFLEGITEIPPAVLARIATVFRGTLARALEDSDGVITEDRVNQAETAVGCHVATSG